MLRGDKHNGYPVVIKLCVRERGGFSVIPVGSQKLLSHHQPLPAAKNGIVSINNTVKWPLLPSFLPSYLLFSLVHKLYFLKMHIITDLLPKETGLCCLLLPKIAASTFQTCHFLLVSVYQCTFAHIIDDEILTRAKLIVSDYRLSRALFFVHCHGSGS